MVLIIHEAEDLVTGINREVGDRCFVNIRGEAGVIVRDIPFIPREVACMAEAVNPLVHASLQDVVGREHPVDPDPGRRVPASLCTLRFRRLADGGDVPGSVYAGIGFGVLARAGPDVGEPVGVASRIGAAGLNMRPAEVVGNTDVGDRFRNDAVLFKPWSGEKALVHLVHFRRAVSVGFAEHQSMSGQVVLACSVRIKVLRQGWIGVDSLEIGWGYLVRELSKELRFVREDWLLIV